MREHSTKYLGALKHGATFHAPLVMVLDPEPELEKEFDTPRRDSYINEDLDLAVTAPDGYWVVHRRSWRKYGSASSPCSLTRNGLIQGKYCGQKHRFETRMMRHPEAPEEHTFAIRERRWPK